VAWRTLYESCIRETNPDRFKKLVFQLEEAIVLRYHDLADEPTAFEELQAIKCAAQRLVRLKTEKSGWPEPAPAIALPMPASFPPVSLQPFPSRAVSSATEAHVAPLARGRVQATWQQLVTRMQTALLAAERAWQTWIFKSLK
jgi:hypothetical protein